MTYKTAHTLDDTFVGVLSGLSNSFVGSVSDILTAIATLVSAAFTAIKTWHYRSVQRNHLLELDNRQLDDIGLNRGQAMQEANKPFWRS